MKEHIILFGAGVYAKSMLSCAEKFFCIDAVCDNNKEIQGQLFCDKYRIISVDDIERNYKESTVLIALNSKKAFDMVCTQLTAVGIRHEHINAKLLEASEKNSKDFFIDAENISLIEKIKQAKQNIFVFTAPSHSNLGDQAQSYCIETMLKEKYPNGTIYLFDESRIVKNFYELLYIVKQNLSENDLILLHSGYRLTNLYMVSEYIVEMMAELFQDRKMVFLPQTIHYTDEQVEQRVSQYIKENVTILCRDSFSLENAKRIFPRSKSILYPDVVTSLIGRYQFNHKREGILLVIRSAEDGESLLSTDNVSYLQKSLKALTTIDITDTTIEVDWKLITQNKKFYIENEIEKYSRYQLIITNRYHGTIFALAANTHVIVLPTKDHKVTAGLSWFKEAGYDGVDFCSDLSKIYNIAEKILSSKEDINHSVYFCREYFNFRI